MKLIKILFATLFLAGIFAVNSYATVDPREGVCNASILYSGYLDNPDGTATEWDLDKALESKVLTEHQKYLIFKDACEYNENQRESWRKAPERSKMAYLRAVCLGVTEVAEYLVKIKIVTTESINRDNEPMTLAGIASQEGRTKILKIFLEGSEKSGIKPSVKIKDKVYINPKDNEQRLATVYSVGKNGYKRDADFITYLDGRKAEYDRLYSDNLKKQEQFKGEMRDTHQFASNLDIKNLTGNNTNWGAWGKLLKDASDVIKKDNSEKARI